MQRWIGRMLRRASGTLFRIDLRSLAGVVGVGLWRETSAASWSCQGRGGSTRGAVIGLQRRGPPGRGCAGEFYRRWKYLCSAVQSVVPVACTNSHSVCMQPAPWNGPWECSPGRSPAPPRRPRVVSKGGRSPLVPRAEISEIKSRPRPRLKRAVETSLQPAPTLRAHSSRAAARGAGKLAVARKWRNATRVLWFCGLFCVSPHLVGEARCRLGRRGGDACVYFVPGWLVCTSMGAHQ